MNYKIYPLHLGTFTSMEKSNLMYQTNPGEKVKQPILGWLLLGGDTPIVIDTGGSGEVWAEKHHDGLKQTEELTMTNQLNKHNVFPDDVKTVINTHLHWDHCFQNKLFKNADIYVQKKEIQAAVAPIPTQQNYYETNIPGEIPSWMINFHQIKLVDGDVNLQQGIDLILLPGHSPGMQGVMVQTEGGKYLIPGDTVGVYENWTGNESMKHIPQGIHWYLEAYFESFDRMEKFDANILASHDFRILEHKFYG